MFDIIALLPLPLGGSARVLRAVLSPGCCCCSVSEEVSEVPPAGEDQSECGMRSRFSDNGLCLTARGRAPQVEGHGFEVASHQQLWHPMFVVFVVSFTLRVLAPLPTALIDPVVGPPQTKNLN